MSCKLRRLIKGDRLIAVIHAALLSVHGLAAVLSLQQIKLDKTAVVVASSYSVQSKSSLWTVASRMLSSGARPYMALSVAAW